MLLGWLGGLFEQIIKSNVCLILQFNKIINPPLNKIIKRRGCREWGFAPSAPMGGSALAGRVPWLPNQQADKNGLATPVAMLFVERDQPITEELAVGELPSC